MRRNLGLFSILFAFALTSVAAQAQATWYLTQDIEKDSSWNTAKLWNSAPDGTGTPATSISLTDIYDTNGRYVRSNGTFTGGKLLQSGGRIDIKRATQTVAGDWEVAGAKASLHQGIRNDASYVFTVKGRLILTSPLMVCHTNNGMRGIDLTVNTLTGASDLVIGTGNPDRNTVVSLGVLKFENHTGKIIVRTGSTLVFANDQKWSGPLEVHPGAFLTLNKAVAFPAATLGGQPVSPGTYAADQLRQTHPGVITEGSTGTLTVGP